MIEVTFDHDNDNIEVRMDDKLKFEYKVDCSKKFYPSDIQKFFTEFVNALYGHGLEVPFNLSICEQNEGQRRTVEEW